MQEQETISPDMPEPTTEQKILELKERHHTLDVRLQELDAQISLTTEEQFERKRIQKMKLLCKDQIAFLKAQS